MNTDFETKASRERICRYCKTELHGRSDKVFCSTPCRNAWHNQERHLRETHIRIINRILRKNWKILSGLNKATKIRVERSRLLALGFDFDYYTSLLTTRAGKTYYYCYDQGYLDLGEDRMLLVRSHAHPDPSTTK